jgi:hypothetical protein
MTVTYQVQNVPFVACQSSKFQTRAFQSSDFQAYTIFEKINYTLDKNYFKKNSYIWRGG